MPPTFSFTPRYVNDLMEPSKDLQSVERLCADIGTDAAELRRCQQRLQPLFRTDAERAHAVNTCRPRPGSSTLTIETDVRASEPYV
jgi:hypothetical protein